MDNNFIVNIGRQLGSGGREIGEKLATRLGIDFYDKELIRLASEESGLCCRQDGYSLSGEKYQYYQFGNRCSADKDQ